MRHKAIYTVVTAFAVLSNLGYADHGVGGGVNSSSVLHLQRQSQRLVQLVRTYGLGYSVEDACLRFDQDVDQLSYCRDQRDPIIGHPGHPGHPGHGGPVIINPLPPGHNGQCHGLLNQARRSFQIVERFLYDTNYQYPQVYRQYLATRQALQNVSLNGGNQPFPGAQNFVCVAVDSGWEEHGGGHRGYGRNIEVAQRAAMFECQTYHGACRLQRCDRVR